MILFLNFSVFSQLKIFLDINGLFNFASRIPHASADSQFTAAFVDRQFVCCAFHRHFFQAGYVFSFEHFFPVRIVRTADRLAFARLRYDHVAFKYRKRKKYRPHQLSRRAAVKFTHVQYVYLNAAP